MKSEYTEHVKQVIDYIKSESVRLHSRTIRPEHFMLGILVNGQGKAIEVLRSQGVDLEALRIHIEEALINESKCSDTDKRPEEGAHDNVMPDTIMSHTGDRTLKLSQLEARMLHQDNIGTEHLVLAMLKDNKSSVSQLMQQYNVDYKSFHEALTGADGKADQDDITNEDIEAMRRNRENNEEDEEDEEMSSAYTPAGNNRQVNTTTAKTASGDSDTPTLDRFGFDVTQAAREGKLDPVVGRESEIERVAQILSRRKKNNPILLGEPGVGKTAIVEGLAQRIVEKEVSFLLKNKRIVSLDMAGLVAGTKYRGQFEERLKGIMQEVSNNPNIILYIDEIHTMVGAGNAQGSMDAANMLKPALSRGEMQCIGSTTLAEFRKSIEKDGALERRFQKVIVEPTNAADTLAILHNIRDRYEEHHCVRFSDEALQACVTLSDRYITDRNFPDKAIDVMDEAGSRMHLFSGSFQIG